jgi:hypothetical protein
VWLEEDVCRQPGKRVSDHVRQREAREVEGLPRQAVRVRGRGDRYHGSDTWLGRGCKERADRTHRVAEDAG